MSSYTANGKRRRLDQAATALSKPFKSPLRRPISTSKGEETPSVNPKTEEKAVTLSTQTTTPNGKRTTSPPPLSNANANALPTPPPTRKRRPLPPARKPLISDPELLTLQTRQRSLQTNLSKLKSELDTVQQALRIESSNRDVELEALILKWKKVSQDAAEEVFSGAAERVSRMGGVKGWKERTVRDFDRKWEEEENGGWFGYGGEDKVEIDGDEDEDEIEARKAVMRGEVEKMKQAAKGEDESEEFTMDMMLKTLNIDLRTIGYDKSDRRWVKG